VRETPDRKKHVAVILGILLLALGAVGAYFLFRTNPHLARMKALQDQLRARAENLSPEDRRNLFRQIGEERQKLSPADRDKLSRERAKAGLERRREQMKKYFALSDDDKKAYLDEQIDQEEARRKDREQRRADRGDNAQGPGQRGNRQGFGPGGGGRGDNSSVDRGRGRKNRLNETTPEDRQQWSTYVQELSQRRQQRGLPPLGGGRGGFGGRGGRPF
jgi:hypothetical protein